MWLPSWIRNAIGSLEAAQNLSDEVGRLREEVRALEASQVERESQWADVKDSVLRNLKRMNARLQHEADKQPGSDPVRDLLLSRKFPRAGGS